MRNPEIIGQLIIALSSSAILVIGAVAAVPVLNRLFERRRKPLPEMIRSMGPSRHATAEEREQFNAFLESGTRDDSEHTL